MAGRKRIEIDLGEVERLAGLGLTEKEICYCIGISEDTLGRRKRYFADFAESIKKGKAATASVVANKLFGLCKKGNLPAIIWYEKTRRGLTDKLQVSGDQENPLLVATRDTLAGFAPRSVGDSQAPGEDPDGGGGAPLGEDGSGSGPRDLKGSG